MVSTLESHKHLPSHIKQLISELGSGGEVIGILSRYIPYLASDTTLYYIFLHFGYSPEHGNFFSPPSVSELITNISKEYHSNLPEIEESFNKTVTEIRKEFLKSFQSRALIELAEPSELDLVETLNIKQEPQEDFSDDCTSENKQTFTSIEVLNDMTTPRVNKGLKILSKKIRDILIQKGSVSYKEMADEVVIEMEANKEIDREKEERNILRRIYDSLNVLEACGVVGKNEKKYFWTGLPTMQTEENETLTENISKAKFALENKRESLRELCKRYFSLYELILRNSDKKKNNESIGFPFIIAATEEHHTNKVRNI